MGKESKETMAYYYYRDLKSMQRHSSSAARLGEIVKFFFSLLTGKRSNICLISEECLLKCWILPRKP